MFVTPLTSPLGIPGYRFADLHDPDRLASLYERFCEQVQAADPSFWRDWDAYRQAPEAPRPPVALSNLLVGMAPHVSRFVARLFDVDTPVAALEESTRAQDALFRFKVDFVRRRALPLLKGGAKVARTAEDDAIVERMIAEQGMADRELAVARAGCALLDAEKANPESRTPNPDPIGTLDVSVLQDQLLAPILQIGDVRTDKRIDFVGGARGTAGLECLVNAGKAAAAFALYPVSVADLMSVSDAGEIMPPKSTWFEPKLRDGLLIHLI